MIQVRKMQNRTVLIIVLLLLFIGNGYASPYYVSKSGNDSHSGTDQANSWQSLDKVNGFSFQPGDSILFKRGDSWRGQLIPRSGNASGYVYYGAYGIGDRPLIFGSVNLSDSSDWIQTGNSIWTPVASSTTGSEMIVNPSFDVDTYNWFFHFEGNADAVGERAADNFASAQASFRIKCATNGDSLYDIQLSTQGLSVVSGQTYCLSFCAKASKGFQPAGIFLMKSTAPYDFYFSNAVTPSAIDTVWKSYTMYYKSSVTANDAMVDFFLGNALPDSSVLYLDDIRLKKVIFNSPLTVDAGNLIFNDAKAFGVKKSSESELQLQGDFRCDLDSFRLQLYSATNPGLFYNTIECALSQNIINQENKSYVTYENIGLKYGGAHGIGGGNTDHIIIRKCAISHIGGGFLNHPTYGIVRYGNGIEFWGNASNALVEQCSIGEIYDAALTNQNEGSASVQSNIIYRNNLIYNAEWSYEYWNRPASSLTQGIYFINNTCLFAGSTWAHAQRPDKRGRHLNFFQNDASTHNFFILNNIFYEATSAGLYVLRYFDLDSLTLNYNNWYRTRGDTLIDIRWGAASVNTYTTAQFTDYQNQYIQDGNSIVGDPGFVDTVNLNFLLSANSPCIDAGIPDSTGIPVGEYDLSGSARVRDGNGISPAVIDIGCYEYEQAMGILNRVHVNRPTITFHRSSSGASALIRINEKLKNASFVMFNPLGRVVFTQRPIHSQTLKVPARSLSNGVVIYRIVNNHKPRSGKCIIP